MPTPTKRARQCWAHPGGPQYFWVLPGQKVATARVRRKLVYICPSCVDSIQEFRVAAKLPPYAAWIGAGTNQEA